MHLANDYHALDSFLQSNDGSIVLPASLHDCYWVKTKPKLYAQVSLFLPDGMPIVLYCKHILGQKTARLYGPEVMDRFVSENLKSKHLLLGSTAVVTKLRQKYPHVKSISVPFKSEVSELVTDELIEDIKKYNPKYVWIGIGSPRQVEFATILKKHYPKGKYFCVGAAFDFLAGEKRQAPKWVRSLGFEWLFRLLLEPRRMWKRYLVYSVVGFFDFIKKTHSFI